YTICKSPASSPQNPCVRRTMIAAAKATGLIIRDLALYSIIVQLFSIVTSPCHTRYRSIDELNYETITCHFLAICRIFYDWPPLGRHCLPDLADYLDRLAACRALGGLRIEPI